VTLLPDKHDFIRYCDKSYMSLTERDCKQPREWAFLANEKRALTINYFARAFLLTSGWLMSREGVSLSQRKGGHFIQYCLKMLNRVMCNGTKLQAVEWYSFVTLTRIFTSCSFV